MNHSNDEKIIRDKDGKPLMYRIKNRWDSKTPAKSNAELRKIVLDLEKEENE